MAQVSEIRAASERPDRFRVVRNSASAVLLYFVNLVVTFLLSPVIVRALGNRDYGIWDLLLGLCGYLGLLEVGIGPALIRYVARSAAEGDQLEVRRTLVTSSAALGAAGLVSFFAMSLVSLSPYRIFNIAPAASPHLRALCVLAGCNLMVQFSGTAAVGYLMGMQEHYRINLLRIVMAAVSAAATYLALTRGGGSGLLWLSSLLLAGNLIQYGTFFLWVRKRMGRQAWSRRLFSRKKLEELFRFGVNSSLMMLADRIQRQSVPFVIGHTVGVASIVFFSIPGRLVAYGSNLAAAIGFPLTPFFSAAEARGLSETRRAWLEANRWLGLATMGMAVGLAVLGRDFIAIWIGGEYAEQAKWIVPLLAAAMFVEGMVSNSGRLLVSLGRHGRVARKLVFISTGAISAAIPAGMLFGMIGIVASVSLANICGSLVCWREACSCLRIGMLQHMRSVAVASGPAVGAFAVCLAALKAAVRPADYAVLAGEAAAASIVYAAAVWHLTLDSTGRKAVAGAMESLAARLARRAVRIS